MSHLTSVKEQIYDDVVTVVNGFVTAPNSHVIREGDDEPEQPPMVALNGRVTARSNGNSRGGMHTFYVFEVVDNPFDVRYGEERTFEVDLTIADVDDDRADSLLDAIHNAFTYDSRFNAPSNFLSAVPIDDVRVEDSSPTDREQRIGHALTIEIDFVRDFWFSDVDDPPATVSTVVQEYESYPITVTTTDSGVTVEE